MRKQLARGVTGTFQRLIKLGTRIIVHIQQGRKRIGIGPNDSENTTLHPEKFAQKMICSLAEAEGAIKRDRKKHELGRCGAMDNEHDASCENPFISLPNAASVFKRTVITISNFGRKENLSF